MNKIILIVIILAVLAGGFFLINGYIYKEKQGDQTPALDHKNATYVIEGKVIKLTDGLSESEAAPNSASKIVTKYFGNEVMHDFDKDGRDDIAFLLTQETGGSGVFYYVVAALNKETGYEGTQGLLLGDRISPQTTEMGTGDIVIVNYADRAAGESFDVKPSVAKSIWLFLDVFAMQFGQVEKDFEGEADPSRMSLPMKTWRWIETTYNDGRKILPSQSMAFTVDFLGEGQFSATTDCNRIAGSYLLDTDNQIVFSDMISTKMFCADSQESDFAQMLENSSSYHFTSKGELILDLKFDSGSVIFR
jgi:heat shock protein HslJ